MSVKIPIYASLSSIGAYVPSRIVSNEDLSKIVETSDEWITKRTGIKERRFAEDNEATSDLATKAARIASAPGLLQLGAGQSFSVFNFPKFQPAPPRPSRRSARTL